MAKITIDLDAVAKWVDDTGKMVLTPQAEDALKQLLSVQKHIDDAISMAKANIEKEALKYNPNFTGLKTSKFKITYRAYGGRYKIDESYIDELPEDLYETKVRYTPNTKQIDTFIEENDGLLPVGIEEVERQKQISVKELENEQI